PVLHPDRLALGPDLAVERLECGGVDLREATAGSAAPGWGARRHPGPEPRGGGGAGSVSCPRRCGHRPGPGTSQARGVPASPWPDLAGRLELEPQARAVAPGAALRGCRPYVDLRPLPLDRGGAAASPAGPRVRPTAVLRAGSLRRGRAPAVLLPGS